MAPFSNRMDLCIIGGGITGAGVALDAARRGLKVALHEQFDFGFGASTATSKLAHGGLRYLESRQFSLVKESLNERNFLLKKAKHLVKPLQFYVPLYKHSKWKPWKLKAGLTIYDWMQNQRILPTHRMINQPSVSAAVPWLKTEDMIGCGSYYDSQMEDHRLIMELLIMAHNEGAHVMNYSKVTNIESTSSGLGIDVMADNATVSTMNASSVVLATGAWNNQFFNSGIVKPTKGIHLVLPDMDLGVALLLMTPQDQRVFFMMPWQGRTLVGTTDQTDDKLYDSPSVNANEVQYLLDAVNAYHTKKEWQIDHVEAVFVGYRPLIITDEKKPSKQPREESYIWLDKNVLAVSGGKYTTYRLMAERALNMIQSKVFPGRILTKSGTGKVPFIGQMDSLDWPSDTQLNQISERYHIQRESIIHIIETYGSLYKEILNTISYQKEYAIRFDIGLPIVIAELKYALSKEWVKTLDDFLLRRTYYGYLYKDNAEFLFKVAKQFKQMTGSSQSEEDLLTKTLQRVMINA